MKTRLELEKELVDFLMNVVPVKWTKIAFYGMGGTGMYTMFYGVREKETDIVVNMDTFEERYDEYPYPVDDIPHSMIMKVVALYNNAYEEYGDKVWHEFVCTIEADGEYKFEYIYPNNKEYKRMTQADIYEDFHRNDGKTKFMTRAEFLKKYLDSDYICVNSKYPSKEFVPADQNHLL